MNTRFSAGLPRKFAPHEHKRSSWREVRNVRGQLIVELLIAFGLASILIPAVILGFISGTNGRVQQEQRLKATGYLKEAEEATRSVRDEDWNNIATNGTYHPVSNGTSWSLAAGSETVGDFARSIVIADTSPSDVSKKLVTITVSWSNIFPTNVTSTFILARWKNVSYSPIAAGGTLVGQGFGNWCKPSLSTTDVDLNRQGHATTVEAIELGGGAGNRVITGTGENASGPAFSNILIQGDNPPSLVSSSDYNGTPQIKANDIYGESNFAYLATDHQGVEILSLAANPPQQVGSFEPQHIKNAMGIYVVGNTGYVVTQDKFYIFSISADRTSTSLVGQMDFTGGSKLFVDDAQQYAYIVTDDLGGQLKIVDIHSNPSAPSVYSQVSVNGGPGKALYVDQGSQRVYLATATSVTQPEFFIVDISNVADPVAIAGATYDTNGMDPRGVAKVSSDRVVIVGENGHEYQVFSLNGDSVENCPNHNDGDDYLDVDSGIFGISAISQSNGHAYSYIITGDASAELKIIEGGAGGGAGGNGGTFESNIFDCRSAPTSCINPATFNRFTEIPSPSPAGVTTNYQIAVSSDCSTFNYTGSYDSNGGAIPQSINPGYCFRYKVTFSNAGGATSASTSVKVNYSP